MLTCPCIVVKLSMLIKFFVCIAEMTSLAKQLEKLAVPQSQVLLRADKKRASLLFDPKEAANFDKEVFYSIGVSIFWFHSSKF